MIEALRGTMASEPLGAVPATRTSGTPAGFEGLRQPHSEAVIAAIHIAQADATDPAMKRGLNVLAQAGPHISSPSFLICS